MGRYRPLWLLAQVDAPPAPPLRRAISAQSGRRAQSPPLPRRRAYLAIAPHCVLVSAAPFARPAFASILSVWILEGRGDSQAQAAGLVAPSRPGRVRADGVASG